MLFSIIYYLQNLNLRKGIEMKLNKLLTLLPVAILFAAGSVYSHCEIPCGIYDDSARVAEMREHVTTIEKSMNQIVELSSAGEKNYNQLVRWVVNKEAHADKLQEVATQYFMFQRIKPADMNNSNEWNSYTEKLTLLHKITVEAMKAKQATDLAHVETLRTLITAFETAYFGK